MPKSAFRRVIKRVLIATNLIVAALFLIGCYSELFFSASWWPVGFLTLSSFYLLVGLLLFFLLWLFARSGWALIFLVTAGISFQHIKNIVPFRFSSGFNMQKEE